MTQSDVPFPPGYLAAARPYTSTCLLALVDVILRPPDSSRERIPYSIAQSVCLRWGKLVPWCWVSWADRRLANAEIVTTVVRPWNTMFYIITLISKV